jgi:hypothetical protein
MLLWLVLGWVVGPEGATWRRYGPNLMLFVSSCSWAGKPLVRPERWLMDSIQRVIEFCGHSFVLRLSWQCRKSPWPGFFLALILMR